MTLYVCRFQQNFQRTLPSLTVQQGALRSLGFRDGLSYTLLQFQLASPDLFAGVDNSVSYCIDFNQSEMLIEDFFSASELVC